MEEIFFYFVLSVTLYLFTNHLFHKLRNLPPSPFPSLPIIGHLYLLKKPHHRYLAKISAKYGSILFLKFGSRPVLLVSSPSAAEECLAKNDVIFANRPRLLAGKYIGNNYTGIAWASYGQHWRNLRKIASLEILSSHRIQMLSGIRTDEVRATVKQVFKASSKGSNQTVEIKSTLFELTLNVMMRMIAGKRYYGENVAEVEEARRFQEIVRDTFRYAGATNLGDYMPLLRFIGFGGIEKKLKEVQRKRDGFMQSLIEEHRQKMVNDYSSGSSDGKINRTMIEVLLALQEKEPDYYSDDIIRTIMLGLLAAGTDTSSGIMEWAMTLLLNNPEVLKKAVAEIDNHVGHDRLLEESDLGKLPYLHSITVETMRMYPTGPLLPHESSEESYIGNHRVPRGTMILVNLWAIQNDPKVWKDPRKFNPERFEELEGERDGFKLMPFGSGRRSCPGEGLATHMVGLTLGSLIQCFDWERIGPEMVDMTEGSGLTLPKAQPLIAKCKPRPTIVGLLSQI